MPRRFPEFCEVILVSGKDRRNLTATLASNSQRRPSLYRQISPDASILVLVLAKPMILCFATFLPNCMKWHAEACSQAAIFRVPGMGDNLVVKVHYRLGSRNC